MTNNAICNYYMTKTPGDDGVLFHLESKKNVAFEMMCDVLKKSVYVCKRFVSTSVYTRLIKNYLGPQRRSAGVSTCCK